MNLPSLLGIQAEVCAPDGLLDYRDLAGVIRIGHDQCRLWNGQTRDLIQRHLGPVSFNLNGVEDTNRRPTGF